MILRQVYNSYPLVSSGVRWRPERDQGGREEGTPSTIISHHLMLLKLAPYLDMLVPKEKVGYKHI